MSINQNKESLINIAVKAGMSKNLASNIIEAMGDKEFNYRSRYNIEAKRFSSYFANEIGFKNFYVFDKTLRFYDDNQKDLVDFIQKHAKNTPYKSANHFIINIPTETVNHLETLSCKQVSPSDADLMLKGDFVSKKTKDTGDWQAEYAEELNNLYKNRMVMAATTILIEMHREHFSEKLAKAHEISEALTDLSKFVLKSSIDSISDFYFLGDYIAAYERIIPAYSIGAMGAFNDISKAYEENGLSDIYDVFSSNLSALREQDEDYGFMGVEDENDLFIATANLPHFYDTAVDSDDVVFRQLTAANGYHLNTLIQDKDSSVKKTIIKHSDNAARSQLMNDKDKEVIELLILSHTIECALYFAKSDIVEYRIAAAQRLEEDLLISAGLVFDESPLVRMNTINRNHKKILDILSNDSDDAIRKAAQEAKAEPKDKPFCGDLDDFFF